MLGAITPEEHRKYSGKGIPKPGSIPDTIEYQLNATFIENSAKINNLIEINSCYVVGTNILPSSAAR